MAKMTPEQEAAYALDYGLPRKDLPKDAQLAYDVLYAERQAGRTRHPAAPAPHPVPARSSPEVRARILEMFKRGNSKYAKPFEKDRLAVLSVLGGN